MPLVDEPDCLSQIKVPPKLPMILKQFCKAAIRTQPYDLLKWSSAYFRALANGEEPPVKLRLEFPGRSSSSGLTLGYLKVMLRQLGDCTSLSMDKIIDRWDSLCLGRDDLRLIILIGKFRRECDIKKFCAIALGLLTSNLTETMTLVCELFTHEPEGGSSMIPLGLFVELYGYLAGLACEDSNPDDWEFTEEQSETKFVMDLDASPAKVETGPSSHASQDTNADIELECDSLSKDDVAIPTQNESDIVGEKLTSILSALSTQELASSTSSSYGDIARESKHSGVQTDDIDCCCLKGKTKLDKCECKCCESSSKPSIITKNFEYCDAVFAEAAEKKFRPNVPGIGPRLTPEEVTGVSLWLTDCARRQQGMVAPRNLRHMYCPPLDRRYKDEQCY